MMDYPIVHNPSKGQFELTIEGKNAVVNYFLSNDTMTITHTYVPHALEGRGIGSTLASYVLNYAMENHFKVIPACSFIRVYLDRHPQYAPLRMDNDQPKR
jgi:hypothetical protein